MLSKLRYVRKGILTIQVLLLLMLPLIATSSLNNYAKSPTPSISALPDPGWTNVTPTSSLPPRTCSPLVYDSESDRCIIFSGRIEDVGSYNDTWAYHFEDNSWTNMSPTVQPPCRNLHGLSYDTAADRIILFSGVKSYTGGHLVNHQDTWTYDFNTNTWTNRSPAVMPPGRSYFGMAYDIESDKTIFFGGVLDGGTPAGDTWAYDYTSNTWTNMDPPTHPSARYCPPIAYDAESDRIILFGGGVPTTYTMDTWAYDYNSNTWTQMNPQTSPPIIGSQLTYDSVADRVITFGGFDDWAEYDVSDQTWVYDYNSDTWTQMNEISKPLARGRAALAYDIQSQRTILYGGRIRGGDDWYGDTWTYEYPLPTSIPIPPEWLLIISAVVITVIISLVIIYYFRRR